jgi:hypothetical protein
MYLVGDRISTSHKNMRLTQLFLENMKQKRFITLDPDYFRHEMRAEI